MFELLPQVAAIEVKPSHEYVSKTSFHIPMTSGAHTAFWVTTSNLRGPRSSATQHHHGWQDLEEPRHKVCGHPTYARSLTDRVLAHSVAMCPAGGLWEQSGHRRRTDRHRHAWPQTTVRRWTHKIRVACRAMSNWHTSGPTCLGDASRFTGGYHDVAACIDEVTSKLYLLPFDGCGHVRSAFTAL